MPVHFDTDFPLEPSRSTQSSSCVLILSGDAALVSDVTSALAGACVIRHAQDAPAAIDLLDDGKTGVLLVDALGSGAEFRDLSREIRRRFPRLVVVAVGDRDTAVSLIDLFNDGLIDRILLRPLAVDQVRQQVQGAVRQHLQSPGDGERADLPAAFVDTFDWDDDVTEPQPSMRLVKSPSIAPVAPSEPDVASASPPLPVIWRVEALPVMREALRRPWQIGGGAAAALAAALILILTLRGSEDMAHQGPRAAATVAAASAEVRRALEAAGLAMEEARYVRPAEDNALDHYLAVLEVDPRQSQAVAGIDTIVAVLLQQAQAALDEKDLENALDKRRLAWNLRPEHTAIPFVDAEFAKHGRSLTAAAMAAVASGDLSGAGEKIDLAARFLPQDSPDLAAARTLLADRRDQVAIDDRLALVEERIAANSLTMPEDDSAAFHLLALRADYPGNEKVVNGLEHLVDRMLQWSEAAIREEEFAEATKMLNRVDELGVRSEALMARRETLANVARQKAAAEALLIAEAALMEASLQEELALAEAALKAEAAPAAAEITPRETGFAAASDPEPIQVASTTQVTIDPPAGAGAMIESGPLEITELEIQRMVEPKYPRRAYVRDIDGWIDLEFTVTESGQTTAIEVTGAKSRGWFERAAVEAVRQWRFRPELEDGRPVERRARVRLQFTRDAQEPALP